MATLTRMSQQPDAPSPPANVAVNGAAIRARRIELGENLVKFAPRVPLSFQYLSQIELGRRPRVSPRTFRLLAEALDMTDRIDELKAVA